MHNIVPRLTGSPGGFRRPAPGLGEHTDEILAELRQLPRRHKMRNTIHQQVLPLWRSILFVPAVSDRFVESAFKQPADLLQIDLEDSVGPLQKDEARARVGTIADRFAAAGRDVSVRVNRPWRLLVRDLEATVRKSVLAIALPKIPDASFVVSVGEVLAELEREQGLEQGHTRIIGMVEDAEGLSNMNEIASAHSRMVGLIVGAEDLAVSMRMAVDDDGLYVPQRDGRGGGAPRRHHPDRLHRLRGRLQGPGGFPRANPARAQARLRCRLLCAPGPGAGHQRRIRADSRRSRICRRADR